MDISFDFTDQYIYNGKLKNISMTFLVRNCASSHVLTNLCSLFPNV